MKFSSSFLSLLFLCHNVECFTPSLTVTTSNFSTSTTTQLNASNKKNKKGKSSNNTGNSSGKGFGLSSVNKSKISVSKTYGSKFQQPVADIIDMEAAMKDFFAANEEYHPLFRSIIDLNNDNDDSKNLPAMSFLNTNEDEKPPIEELFDALPQVPTGDEEKMAVVAKFLDSTQQALLDITVNEGTQDDEHDLHFIEEGRRCLVLNRFQVLSSTATTASKATDGGVEQYDVIFSTCWSEITSLLIDNQPDTGSLIILPDKSASNDGDENGAAVDVESTYEMADLRRFIDQNILRPLDWMGLGDVFEVASLQRDSPAIRLIHKLSGIPKNKPEE